MTEGEIIKEAAAMIRKGAKSDMVSLFIHAARKENLKKALQSGWTLSNI